MRVRRLALGVREMTGARHLLRRLACLVGRAVVAQPQSGWLALTHTACGLAMGLTTRRVLRPAV